MGSLTDPSALIPCPFCAELILPQAIKCRYCKTFLKGEEGLDPKAVEAAEQEISKLTAAADEPADLTGQPGKFRTWTWITTAVSAGSAAWLGWVIATDEGGSPAIIVPIVLCIAFGLAWMILFFTDVGCPSPRGRATPRAAFNAYLGAVKIRRWKAAHACLSPAARTGPPVEIPEIPEIGSDGGTTTFESTAGLAAYWRSMTHYSGSFGQFRRITRVGVAEVSSPAPNVIRLSVSISIERYPQWLILAILGGVIGIVVILVLYYLLRKTWTAEFDCVVYKHRSQWWLLTGQIDSPLDRHVFPHDTPEGPSTVLP